MTYTRLTKDAARLPDEDPTMPGWQTTNVGYPNIAGGGLALAGSLTLVIEADAANAEQP